MKSISLCLCGGSLVFFLQLTQGFVHFVKKPFPPFLPSRQLRSALLAKPDATPKKREKKNKYAKFSNVEKQKQDPMETMIQESKQKLEAIEQEKLQSKKKALPDDIAKAMNEPLKQHFPDNKDIDPYDPSSFGYTEVGTIVGCHGVHGWVKLKSSTDFPQERLCQPGVRHLKPYQKRAPRKVALVEGRSMKNDEYLLLFEGVNDREQAKQMRGATLYVREEDRLIALPDEPIEVDEETEFLVSDLVGLEVFLMETTDNHNFVGSIAGVVLAEDMCAIPGLGHDMLEILLPRGRGGTPSFRDEMVLIPFVPQIVPRVCIHERSVYITPPDGLLDLTYVREEKVRIKGFLPPAKCDN